VDVRARIEVELSRFGERGVDSGITRTKGGGIVFILFSVETVIRATSLVEIDSGGIDIPFDVWDPSVALPEITSVVGEVSLMADGSFSVES
jgi:hypothetical protein